MKALTLWEPWASLIARGHKIVETRSWSAPLISSVKRPPSPPM